MFKRVIATLTIPSIPTVASDAEFAIHPFDSKTRASSSKVYAVKKGGVLVSEDLGGRWDFISTPETADVRLYNAFETKSGDVLLQGMSVRNPSIPRGNPDHDAPIFLCDKNLKVVSRHQPGRSNWHGPRSIDEAGVIMFAEYPDNDSRYKPEFKGDEDRLSQLCDNSRVFRSSDGGRSWETVFEKSWRDIRHFHTLIADPYLPGTWYLSSGDAPNESRAWRSVNDGDTWTEITADGAEVPLHPANSGKRGSINRHTDMVVLEDRLVWGTDDLLGPPEKFSDPTIDQAHRVGSRVLVSAKTAPLKASTVGFIGSHIRSIVDAEHAYLIFTEAKARQVTTRPQVFMMTKQEPHMIVELFSVERHDVLGTGFTYSRASRAASNGRFFTYRGTRDVFPAGPRMLQWDVAFE